ncbi:hypothetical protein EV177_008045 [Coemansia sp. RSA 1804]|nr:hypothetical protein EV177_008045 [Coemansia sp. RSA 1804]
MVLGLLTSGKQSDGVHLTISPSTRQIVLQQGVTGTNVLVGYVSVRVGRPTSIAGLTVTFTGTQQVDIRAGVGPSGSNHSVRSKCANFSQQLVDETSSALSSAAMVALARVNSAAAMGVEGGAGCGSSAASTYDTMSPPPEHIRQSEDSGVVGVGGGLRILEQTAEAPTLQPGEYRFAFEFALPPTLPASVSSRLGSVEYQLTADLSYRSWFHPRTTARPVSIDVLHAPPLSGAPTSRAADVLLLGYPSLQALTSTPLLFETTGTGEGCSQRLRISVYSPSSSRALFLDTPVRLQVYATHVTQAHARDAPCRAELVEFSVALHEVIAHTVPGSAASQTTRTVVAESSLCPRSASKQRTAAGLARAELPTLLDPQTIDALGESFNELPSVGSLDLLLPSKARGSSNGKPGRRAVQPSSSSSLFAVSHQLHVSVSVRDCDCDTPSRVSFYSPVIVLAEVLARGGAQIAAASLPCYNGIANDIVLAASSLPRSANACYDEDRDRDSAINMDPPDYAALYN